jgi:hypothetical protein
MMHPLIHTWLTLLSASHSGSLPQSLGVGSLCVLLLFALSMLLTRLLAIKQGGFRLWWSHPGGSHSDGHTHVGHILMVIPRVVTL